MVFDLKQKVALITGGSSGIGFEIAKTLLRNGAKGVALADIDSASGQKVVDEIENEFGKNKAIYVETDVTVLAQVENAFKETVDTFKNVDILFNNAGIFKDLKYEREILINMTGIVHGMLLGVENYLQKFRQGEESVIVNTASVSGLGAYGSIPVYAATKTAIVSLTRSWGVPEHYERTKVRTVAICPGLTTTPLLADLNNTGIAEPYQEMIDANINKNPPPQKPEHVAEETMKVIQLAKPGTIWVIEDGGVPYEYIFPERDTMKEHTLY